MTRILLINPNSSLATTEMMLGIARAAAPRGVAVTGVTARRAVPMILSAEELCAAAPEVVEIGTSLAHAYDGVIVSAFGDPGLAQLRGRVDVPVVGICEAAMREAAANGRRFGVATVTPGLVAPIAARAHELGLAILYTGARLTPGDPATLAADHAALEAALADAVMLSLHQDGAAAVAIGGGPLGDAAAGLARRFDAPIVAPIPAAMRSLLRAFGPAAQPTEAQAR